jgi:hypothetical protein
MDADRPEIELLSSPATETRTMTLWHRELTPDLRRELVTRESGADYYRVHYSLPVLELSPSQAVVWNGQAALTPGRVYGSDFDRSNEAYSRWYVALGRWIRSHFVKNPIEGRYGYVGRAALEWFRQGGILLPMMLPLLPAVTPEWLSFVANQANVRATLTPSDRHVGSTTSALLNP